MDNPIQILDIILLAMIAGFIALRLRSVLGNKTGHEQDPKEATRGGRKTSHLHVVENDNDPEPVFVPGPDPVSLEKLPKTAREHFDTIVSLEPEFSIEQFLEGASKAHPMILNSFWQGRMSDVQGFLSEDVYNMFEGAVTAREQDGLTLENSLIETTERTIDNIDVVDRVAKITVRFVSDIVSVTKDEAGDVVDGDVSDAVEVIDIWTFSRELGTRDPNWLLTSTRAG